MRERAGWRGERPAPEEIQSRLVVTLDGILPVICPAAGGNDVCGWAWGRRARSLRKLRLSFVVAWCGILRVLGVVCVMATRDLHGRESAGGGVGGAGRWSRDEGWG